MWRWARWVLVGVVLAGAVWSGWDSHVRSEQRVRDAVYAAKLDQLTKTFPVGTPRGEIETRLGLEPNGEDVKVLLGTYPGDDLVCATWDVYAQFVFGNADRIGSEPLVKIQKTQSGRCL